MKIAKTRPDSGPVSNRLLWTLAGNRSTLVLLSALGAGIVVHYLMETPRSEWLVTIPTVLLMANFLLALAIRGIFRHSWPLLAFHFALLGLVLLAFAGRMTYFQGTLELASNEYFHGAPAMLENVEQGPWHRYSLDGAGFGNLGFRINYRSGVRRDRTVNRVERLTPDGGSQFVEIGDHVPLVVGHYRFYTTHNKGYAPVFEWRPTGETMARVGSVHLPAYPINEYRQALEWQLPGGGPRLWTQLKIDENVLPEDRAFEFSVPRRHRLVIRAGNRRIEMTPGQRVKLPQGELHYLELSTWMGYKIDYDWTRPWLLATAIIGILALFLHYAIRFSLLPSNLRTGDKADLEAGPDSLRPAPAHLQGYRFDAGEALVGSVSNPAGRGDTVAETVCAQAHSALAVHDPAQPVRQYPAANRAPRHRRSVGRD